MGENHPAIELNEMLGALDIALEDLRTDGVISSAIYNKKNQTRMLVYALSRADRHICLQLKLSAHVAIFIPSGQRTVFFLRQQEHISDWLSAHSDLKASDIGQYALLVDEKQFLDVISVLSPYAHAYSSLPISEEADPDDILTHSLPSQTDNVQSKKYLLTGGRVVTERPSGKRFYVEPESRKLILSESFSADRWLWFKAQVAPVATSITGMSTSEVESYKIRSPYYGREWLLYRTLINLLPGRAASEGGYYELEQKSREETHQNQPGTGNVVISGDELDGNYESSFNF